MSLDRIIKEKAEVRLEKIIAAAEKALLAQTSGLPMVHVARLVSGHKIETTRKECIKILADGMAKTMLDNLTTDDS